MKRTAALAFVLTALAMGPVLAEDYPTRPIRILSPYSPGGISDIAARIVAGKLTEAWGQQVIVENRPGGNGFIAVTDAARATPDGYTLVMVTAGDITINPSLFKTVPYDVDHDLAPVSAVSDAPLVLAANGETPYKTLADVIAAAKAQPGMLNIGSPGYGSINHLMLESISLNTGTKFTHVPYKGGAPAVQALVAGDIPLAIIASSTAAPHVASGKISILGISTGERSPLNPEWPPLAQEGAGEINVSNWTALMAPKATPQPIIQKLSAKVIEILNMPDVKARFAAGGVSTIPSTPTELDARIKRELATYRVVIEKANVHVD
ncbi:MAG TPA: tripartite tricarboxylate transporter substrate binding protein [Xanthobacteraceae bacterium]|nr:tripartite tricarboxylate transporter substrate binding protein [Xanthobacteraceae bacterium]